jgi:hypothetical protein
MPAHAITSTVDVDAAPATVYALLDQLGEHRSFTDHYITDWQLSGPDRGVGASARVKVKGGRSEITVVESGPTRIVEHGTGGPGGRWRTTGTYELAPRGSPGRSCSGSSVTTTGPSSACGTASPTAPRLQPPRRVVMPAGTRFRDAPGPWRSTAPAATAAVRISTGS